MSKYDLTEEQELEINSIINDISDFDYEFQTHLNYYINQIILEKTKEAYLEGYSAYIRNQSIIDKALFR